MTGRPRSDRDYYAVLGVSPEATEDEIRKAYRRLALRWHPDRNPGRSEAAERFKEISEAYAVLTSRRRRAEYDTARRAGSGAGFHASREELFRDLFANPGASAIFEDLAREFERMGMRVDRQYFHQTLFGGRGVVTGGVGDAVEQRAVRARPGAGRHVGVVAGKPRRRGETGDHRAGAGPTARCRLSYRGASSIRSRAFWQCSRFSACSNTTDTSDSKTSAVTSSPRWAGRQCMNSAPGLASVIRVSLTW